MTKAIAQQVLVLAAVCGLAVWAAFIAFDRIGRSKSPPVDHSHVAEWVARLQDPDPENRDEASRNVIALGDRAIPLLLPLVEGEDRIGKENATHALLGIHSPAAVPAIIRLVKTGEPRLCRQAIEALGVLGPQARAAVPTLHELVRSKQIHRVEKMGGSCFLPMALARIQGAEAVPILCEMLDVTGLRVEVAEALDFVGDAARAALPALEAAARDEAPKNRQIILIHAESIRLRGAWEMTGIERGGKFIATQTDGAPIRWVIHENRWRKGPANGRETTGFLHVDPMGKPKSMTLWEQANIMGGVNRRFFIYEIDTDMLKISDPGPRSSAFQMEQKAEIVISHWRRTKG